MAAKPADDPVVDGPAVESAEDETLADGLEEGLAEPIPLQLEVDIKKPSACERHVTVTVSREDIDRYFDNAYSAMMPGATVPGFRIGRAPRKIVENRFKQEVTGQVKGSLLMDCLEQLSGENHFAAISEPELDLEAVEVPDDGPMTFEFDIEVRPEFDLPKWKGLKLVRPMREFTSQDVDEQLEQMLTRFAQLAPSKEPATAGSYLTVNIVTKHEGEVLERDDEAVVRVRPVLSFEDCRIENFGELAQGAKPGDSIKAEVTLTSDAPNEAYRGKPVTIEMEVLEVKELKLPELTPDFLQEMGQFDSEEALRDAIKQNLQRQLEYRQQQRARQQITELLTESANWDLPPGLLKRQSRRELERAVMELRRSGFSESEIRARENELRQNSGASTAKALKEHFILERIAEEEKLDVEEGDYEKEIFLMAMQSGESPRRIRAQLEKRGLMDVLRNQIVERKVLEVVQQHAEFKDEKYVPQKTDVEAIALAAGGDGEEEIPTVVEAKADDSASNE